jgi:hypothetical protein
LVERQHRRLSRLARAVVLTSIAAFLLPSVASADVFVAPGASDGNPCTAGAPCGSFERAYQAASPGETVHVAGGSYGGQDIDAAHKSGPDVVFQPAPGASVTVHNIDIDSAAHIEFRNMTVTESTYNRPAAQWITYRGIKMRQLFIRGSDHIRYYDSEVGPNTNDDGMNFISAG